MNEKRVALITGAARGIGRQTAIEFARRGYNVGLVDLLADELPPVVEQVAEAGGEALAIPGDLTDLDFCQAAVQQAVDRWRRLDVLVNNAAWREAINMRKISPESWEKTLRICLTAPAFLSRWAAETMQETGGAIINISSMMSRHAGGLAPAYVAAKGGIDALTYELAALYGPAGIRVLAVNPGAVDTDLSNDYADSEGDSITTQLRQWSEDAIPLRRWAQPAEIARAIVMLAGDEASYITGTTIVVDGGWLHSHFPRPLQAKMDPEAFGDTGSE